MKKLILGFMLYMALPVSGKDLSLKGILIEPAKSILKKEFLDQTSRKVQFPAESQSYKLVFFGFTHCPMVCPTGLQKLKNVMGQLGKNNKTEYYFITIDAERDSPERLKEFLPKFDQRIIGLTGNIADIVAMENQFNVIVRKFQGNSSDEYTMEHSGYIYLLNKTGQIMVLYPATASASDISSDLKQILK